MVTKVFLTGVTGYIGGDVFYAVHQKYPNFDYTLLVRTEERSKPVKEKYPGSNIHFVYGDLDSSDVISKAAAEADIVIHTANSADDVPSAKAIAKGIAEGHSADRPAYWLHLCGTGILTWYDEKNKRYGEAPIRSESYNDIKDIERLINLPDEALHRNVDKIVLAANNSPGVKTAILGPPTIYGQGRGPINQDSKQVHTIANLTLTKGYAPVIGPGKTEWDNTHIHDVSSAMLALVDAALDSEKSKNPEIFGPHGYFFTSSGVHLWKDVAASVGAATVNAGYLKEAPLGELKHTETPDPSLGWNSKGVAERAGKYLGWKPTGASLEHEIPWIVDSEAKKLGKTGSK